MILNQHHIINLEMQVINLNNWQDRSLSYLARNFDHLKKGEDYELTHPVIQIGLLGYTLFPDHPEFYSTYQFLNVKNHTLYSDKLRISVLDLSRIDLAAEADRQYQLDYWAALFKAKTWEELQMLAQNNNYFKEASETVYELTQEEQIRQQPLPESSPARLVPWRALPPATPARIEPWRALVVRLAPNKPKRFSPSESELSMG